MVIECAGLCDEGLVVLGLIVIVRMVCDCSVAAKV